MTYLNKIILIAMLALASCGQARYVVFHVNKKFDGTVEYIFLNKNKCVTARTDTMIYHNRERVTIRQIKKLQKR